MYYRRNPVTGERMPVYTGKEMQELAKADPGYLTRKAEGNATVKVGPVSRMLTFRTKRQAEMRLDENPMFRRQTYMWYMEEEDSGDWTIYISTEYEEAA